MLNQSRIVIENISPVVNCGKYPIKRVVNEIVQVRADIFGDGHDLIQASIFYKAAKNKNWEETRMHPTENDAWEGVFNVTEQGSYQFYIQGWEDHGINWHHGITKKIEDGQSVKSELLEGAEILKSILKKATKSEAVYIKNALQAFTNAEDENDAHQFCFEPQLDEILLKYPHKAVPFESEKFPVYVDRLKARFSTWYEFFPRSASKEKGKHGTFKDCEALLPRVAEMGFDTLFPANSPYWREKQEG